MRFLESVHKPFILIDLNDYTGMEPTFFYSVVLPLAVLIGILVAIVLYLTRKEKSVYERELKKLRPMLEAGTIDKKTFVRMGSVVREELVFAEELQSLHALLRDKIIDQDAYVQIRTLLEKGFRQRLEQLAIYTSS